MKCKNNSYCRCKICKSSQKFILNGNKLIYTYSESEIRYMYDNTRAKKYPNTPLEKELSNRKSLLAYALMEYLYNRDVIIKNKRDNKLDLVLSP